MNLVNMGNKNIVFMFLSGVCKFYAKVVFTRLLYGQYGSSAKYGGYFSW